MHREEDESVPREMTDKLYDTAINAPLKLKQIISVNSAWDAQFNKINEFMSLAIDDPEN